MFNEKILKVAKKVLNKKFLDDVLGSMHYNVEKNLLTLTDTFVLAEIKMPDEYNGLFKDLGTTDVTIDYYTVCGLLAMIEHPDAYWKIATISLGNATVQDFIEYEYVDLRSSRHGIKVRLPIITANKLGDYKEERLFNLGEDKTNNIAVTPSFEKFQEICSCLLNTAVPLIKVSENTYITEGVMDVDEQGYLSLDVRLCVTRYIVNDEELK